MKTSNREAWLIQATQELAALIEAHGVTVPPVRVSTGFPKGGARGNHKAIGQCWSGSCATDGVAQIFIHPMLDKSERVLDVLTHELIHATVGTQCGHKGAFTRLAKSVGLEGKMTATVAGEALTAELTEIVARIGDYPHAALNPASGEGGGKKQGTRMMKCECSDCGYTVRTTRKWLDEMGAPLCPCNGEAMQTA